MTGANERKHLTAQEAAEYLSIPAKTLLDWRYKRVGPPFFKLGKRVIYARTDLDSFLESNKVQTKAAA